MAWYVYHVAALLLISKLCRGDLPEDDFRIVSKRDLMAFDSDLFVDNSSSSFSQLLFDVARDQVIVGARDALYRLSLRGLRELERADWPAPPEKAKLCQDKGQTEADCHNYVKVLLAHGHKLLACGTNAFSPLCSWREIESVGNVSQWVSGVAHCPYNPHSNVTAILASSGEYYAGTTTDFAGSDTAICRSRGATLSATNTLRSTQYDQIWLNEPQFVGSFEDDSFVYFVFREIAVEFLNCGKIIYSRIARVCKNDSGGHLVMKDNWSTFLKARLKCAVPGDVPFHYDEVQSIEMLPQEQLIVASFTTNDNSIAGSAICVYNMSDVRAAFEGPFNAQESHSAAWQSRAPSPQAHQHFRCHTDARLDQEMEYHRYHLMYDPVQPISGQPVYKAILQRFTHVTVDVTTTKVGRQLVVFVANQNSDVLKLAVMPDFDGACLVEVLRLKDRLGGYDVRALQFVKDTMSLYIGAETAVVRVPGERCARHKTLAACAGAADPYCAWDDSRAVCEYGPERSEYTGCPSAESPVDGGWSEWSDWGECIQHGTAMSAYGERADTCRCRTRRCDNPAPARLGQPCHGASISVANCTVHGGWSPWSAWSECSASCGIAVKSRRRSCSAPEPKHGGRVCVGLDQQDLYCANLPPCPDPSLAPIDGNWSPWSAWSPCTSVSGPGCGVGAGWRERRRVCSSPAPQNGGSDCDGQKLDRQPCDLKPCEVKKATAWSPWVQIPGNASDSSYIEKRYKFVCRAQSAEPIKLSIGREEERYCSPRGCSSSPIAEEPGWSSWAACSAACGGGRQTRRCLRPPCHGDNTRLCNTQACRGEWSCWSEWGECTGACGLGMRTRTRHCLSPGGCPDGAAVEQRPCMPICADNEGGWGSWGTWATCDNGEKMRQRACAAEGCEGTQIQVTRERSEEPDKVYYWLPAYGSDAEMAFFVRTAGAQSLGVGTLIGCVIAAFAAGCLVAFAGMVYWQRNGCPWQRRPRVPSSPHYITAKQNSYVTVPLKDVPRKAKRQPSFTGIGGASGILLSKSNNFANPNNPNNQNNASNTPKLYPKSIANEYDSMGTLKRHSHLPSHKNNLDVEEDKFY